MLGHDLANLDALLLAKNKANYERRSAYCTKQQLELIYLSVSMVDYSLTRLSCVWIVGHFLQIPFILSCSNPSLLYCSVQRLIREAELGFYCSLASLPVFLSFNQSLLPH